MDIKIGFGFDVHRFTSGDNLRLCGIDIHFNKKLLGHSDADVALHALTDALFGALGIGDIGTWFPPSEKKWKNAESVIFLDFANNKVLNTGYKISNIDLTIICEEPKISPHTKAMRQFLSKVLNLDVNRINIKATTTENLGFTGRKEGIASQCAVLLLKI